eukprot:9029341-Lingulodinium_polyedra.AAC.1
MRRPKRARPALLRARRGASGPRPPPRARRGQRAAGRRPCAHGCQTLMAWTQTGFWATGSSSGVWAELRATAPFRARAPGTSGRASWAASSTQWSRPSSAP